MTKLFEQANPNIKVNNTLVSYEALHDKIVAAAPAGTYDVVLGDCIWPAEFGSKGIVKDISSNVKSLPTEQIFPGALVMADYKSKYYGMPWILDTKYMYANGSMLKKAGVSPASLKTWDGVVAALKQIKAKGLVKYPWLGSWSQAEAVVCDYAQLLGAFGGKFLDSLGQARLPDGRRSEGAGVHEDADRPGPGRPGVHQLAGGGRAEGLRPGQDRDEPQLDLPARRLARSQAEHR